MWSPELARLDELRHLGAGRRAFLLGNGPSLKAMDLSRLSDDFVCVVNTGLRALDEGLPHADMHLVNDNQCYKRFGTEIEALAARHSIPYRFLNLQMRPRWRTLRCGGNRPFFLIANPTRLGEATHVPDLKDGVAAGSSVLLSAAVLLDYLGFERIYVIGCDLDYETAGQYFYQMGGLDMAHETDANVIAKRRRTTHQVDAQFALLRAEQERKGRQLFNAGVGGKLESLPRVDFASLFDRRRLSAAKPH
jgi:hypothetical protein